ncbi:InlB B-repeat-containing protein [Neobacillus sp. 19]|uniref:InlB B-repeat-containing protein n=1 Tax=Neobacillus sp. 19 TaxID=3394458 RepID=UPI003BF74853
MTKIKKFISIILVTLVVLNISSMGVLTNKAFGATTESKKFVITFDPANGQEVKQVKIVKGKKLKEKKVPFSKMKKEGYDFLGWYNGQSNKYEVIFPFQPDQDITLVAKWGKHTPPSPVKKDGYRLIFDEEFNNANGKLDSTLWVDQYLSSWTRTPEFAKPIYKINNGVMNLQVKEDTPGWAPEYDGETRVSGFTTGNRNGLHNWNGTNVVRNPVDTQLTHINQYGYYEIRAKGQAGSSRHSAWWLLGFEDREEHSAEIDIFEILGNQQTAVPRAFHGWKDKDAFAVKDQGETFINAQANFHDEWHTFGMDWQNGTGAGAYPDKLVFYVDGKEVGSKNVNIDYPMIQLFSQYEKRAGGWTGPWEWMPYPNSFDIDYVRVYKKLSNGQKELSKKQLKVVHVEDSMVTVLKGQAALKQYTSSVNGHEGEVYTEPNLPNTKSYVNVTWNDGVITQEFVKWDPITQEDLVKLNNGESITKNGILPNLNKVAGITNPTLQIAVTTPPPPPPYTSENLGVANSQTELAKLFDSNLESNSGEFRFASNQLPNDKEVNIQYNFNKNVTLHSISFTTNFGQDQGIKKFKLAAWDSKTNSWVNHDKEYSIPWTAAGNTEIGETLKVEIDSLETSKIKMIITEVGLRWENKIAMREIAFN